MESLSPHRDVPQVTFVAAINSGELDLYEGCANAIEFARTLTTYSHSLQRLSAPKVVAAIVDNRVHVAIGFSSDSHDQIADSVFRNSIGEDWRTRANNFGGGKSALYMVNTRKMVAKEKAM